MLKRIGPFFKLTGLVALFAGILLGFLDLRGYFVDEEKQAFLALAEAGKTRNLEATHTLARAFIKDFPPPSTSSSNEIAQIVTAGLSNGKGIVTANFYYKYASGERTGFVADLTDVKLWASQSRYPFVAWWLGVVGFIEVLVSYIIETFENRRERRHRKGGGLKPNTDDETPPTIAENGIANVTESAKSDSSLAG